MATARKKTQDKSAETPLSAAAIAQRAHEIFLARGGQDGRDVEDWLQAELELTKKRRQSQTDES